MGAKGAHIITSNDKKYILISKVGNVIDCTGTKGQFAADFLYSYIYKQIKLEEQADWEP